MSNNVVSGPVPAPAPAPEQTANAPRGGFGRQLLKQPVALVTLIFILAVGAASLAAPFIAPYPPDQLDFTSALSGPTGQHLLGTDDLGRDMLSRLLYGGVPAL